MQNAETKRKTNENSHRKKATIFLTRVFFFCMYYRPWWYVPLKPTNWRWFCQSLLITHTVQVFHVPDTVFSFKTILWYSDHVNAICQLLAHRKNKSGIWRSKRERCSCSIVTFWWRRILASFLWEVPAFKWYCLDAFYERCVVTLVLVWSLFYPCLVDGLTCHATVNRWMAPGESVSIAEVPYFLKWNVRSVYVEH